MPEVKRYTVSEPYLDLGCGLGEAPFWEKDRDTLRFVDIVKEKLHTVKLSEGPSSHKQWDLKYSIGTTADIEGNKTEFIFGGKTGYGVFNKETGEHRIIKEMWTGAERQDDNGGKAGKGKNLAERMRSNDGAVDSKGRFYVGAMNDPAVVGNGNFTDEGILFRLDPDLSIHRVKKGVTIPNGTSWTLDNKTMYLTDSPSGKIMAHPYNPETGELSPEGKVFFTCPYEGGVPDGHCQDEEGHFWVACFGTSKVVRVSPQGEVVAEVEVPTRCVTCPELCGTKLFITTAAEEEPEKYPWSTKYQGALFMIDVGVKGSPRNNFTGKV
ncbi:putative sugar lactone lactonase YvrE [Pseudocercospora fuligena]|uniref:Putative sugar lactone lactonase YvrE n=1 Tax=Pseudocercospora fuligena TaxID=685502 RepID=A0A8H6RKB4_9PEZI|nr:putative sugar lactone lactonase YvrE [Pseudocercospora fuligena]